jgi:hypothetical protein
MSSIASDFNRIHVMGGGAPKEVFALLAPKFEQQTGAFVPLATTLPAATDSCISGFAIYSTLAR